MLKKYVAGLATLVAVGSSAAMPEPAVDALSSYDAVAAHLRQLIDSRMRDSDIAGLSIALVANQRVVWAEGFGHADRKRAIPATPETLYRVGAISQLFTAAAVMQLKERDLLDIDRPLADYLPEFRIRSRFAPADEAVRGITLRHVMTHHAGLPENYLHGIFSPAPQALAALPGKMAGQYVTAPAGTVAAPSNLGYSLLGAAIERVAARDFDQHMREALLRPLGMAAAGFAVDTAMQPRLAHGHKAGEPEPDPQIRDTPAGGLRASAADLANFMRMMVGGGQLDGRRVLEQRSIREMLRVQNASVALDFDCKFGLGWMLSACGGDAVGGSVPIAAHGGATASSASHLLLAPAHELGVVVLSNDASAGPMVGKLAVTAMRLMLGVKTGNRPKPPEDKVPALRQLDARQLAALPGWYSTSLGAVKVRAEQDRLLIDSEDMNIELLGDGRGRLHPRPANSVLRWVFEKTQDDADLMPGGFGVSRIDGRDVVTMRVGGQDLLLGEKVKPVPPPQTWQSAQGRYRVVNAGAEKILIDEAVLRVEDGIVLVETTAGASHRRRRLALVPISDTEAVIHGHGRGLGETLRLERAADGPRIHFAGYEMSRQSPH